MPKPSRTASGLPVSGVREIMDLAWATPGCIRMEVGEPGFPTPPHIVEAGERAAREGWTKYAPNAGLPELRETIADKMLRVNGLTVAPGQVVVSPGAMNTLFTALMTITDPGDGILLPDPAWPNFVMASTLQHLDVQRYTLRPEDGFLPTVAGLADALTPTTRVLLLNTPSNPLGTLLGRERLAEILAFAEQHDLWVISDECYDGLVFDGDHVSTAAVGGADRVISVFTFSKSYAMTGWRVGYAVYPGELAPIATKLQEPVHSCVNAMAQRAAIAALTGPQDDIEAMRLAYKERRDAVSAELDAAGMGHVRPSGAFYTWVDVRDRAATSREFAIELLRREKVAIAPGTAFGPAGEGWARVSLATDTEPLLEGVRRLSRFSVRAA
ncbi:MAG: aminotransferase class I/II-fold pyridoxal phosphate-dependent enzyme [Streptosporangiales bacterium]|nr:aminotransferase class I/II-fold pyridoxal phosphate-dependent enzyme [Streptosporangiales bacterium]